MGKVKNNPPTRVTKALVPRERRWMLDADYENKLNDEEAKYLAQFLDEYYRADYRYEKPMHDTPKLKSERYGMQNANHRDVYAQKAATGELVFGAPVDRRQAGTVDMYPSPRYLESEEYKSAVAELRKLVDVHERTRTGKQRERIAFLQTYLLSIREAENEREA